MSTTTETISLDEFLEYLDSLTGRPSLEELRERMLAVDITDSDIERHAQFSDVGYQRNLIRQGEHYQALLLCWQSGQRSPVHDHAHSICGVKIVRGRATETRFERTPCGQYAPTESDAYEVGCVMVSQDSDVHQVSNFEAKSDDLITLHVYAPPLKQMTTYSMDDGSEAPFVPQIAGFVGGMGI